MSLISMGKPEYNFFIKKKKKNRIDQKFDIQEENKFNKFRTYI